MTFKNYKSLSIGNWNFKKLIRASDGLVLFEKQINPYVTDGLIAMWDGIWNTSFNNHDQNATTWIDLVGNNVVTTTATTAPTTLDNGFRFNGSQYFTVTPDDNIKSVGTNQHDITVEIGFNANPQNTSNQGLLGFGTSSARNIWMFFGNPPTSTSSTLNAQLQNSSSLRLWYSRGVFPSGTKRHVVFSSSSTTISGWLDGIKLSSTPTIGRQTSLGTSFIGRIGGYNNFYGDIYFIRIYNRALTEDEIAANYAVDKIRYGIGETGDELWISPTRVIVPNSISDINTTATDAWFSLITHLNQVANRPGYVEFTDNSMTKTQSSSLMPGRIVHLEKNKKYRLKFKSSYIIGTAFRLARYTNTSGIELTWASSFAPTYVQEGDYQTYIFDSGDYEWFLMSFYITPVPTTVTDISLKEFQ